MTTFCAQFHAALVKEQGSKSKSDGLYSQSDINEAIFLMNVWIGELGSFTGKEA